MKYKTTAAYVSGAICGDLWMPASKGGLPYRKDLRGFNGLIDRFSDTKGLTFRDILLGALTRDGGDFQNAVFTADTYIRIERRSRRAKGGKYSVHVKEIEVKNLRDCEDLVDSESYVCDFIG